MSQHQPPRRVRVVLADRRPAAMPILRVAEVAEQTEIGRELVRGLMRAQLAASLRIGGLALVLFAPLPLLFAAVPVVADVRVLGVPLIWWLLGVAAYPALYLLARLHRRQAERIERDFTDLLERGRPAVDGSTLSLIAIALVVVATGVIGATGLRFARTTSEFLVASRSVGPKWNAAAISGEYLSAASIPGVAGLIAVNGPDALWYPVGFTAGFLALQLFVAVPLRRSGAYTVPDFAQIRWGSRRLRAVSTALVLVIAWLYLVPQLHGAGLVLQEVTGLPGWVGIAGVGLLMIVYVVFGGMRAPPGCRSSRPSC